MDLVITLVGLAVLGAIVVAREISMRRQLAEAREALADARSRLHERNDLASVGQLVTGLAHELKSPLQGVLGNTEVMLAATPLDAAVGAELEQIRADAVRAAGIVRHLLAFTETTTLSRRWHDINTIIDRAIDACRGDLETWGTRVETTGGERLPPVYVDGRQLEKVIITLLGRPPMYRTGTLGAAADSGIKVDMRRSADRLVIDLDDRTGGAASDEPAWAADVAACRRVLEVHGGSLEVESRPGAGFRFHMELPLAVAGGDRLPTTS